MAPYIVNRHDKFQYIAWMYEEGKKSPHIAAYALADTRAERNRIRFDIVDGRQVVRFLHGGSSLITDQFIHIDRFCDLDIDQHCLAHGVNHYKTLMHVIDINIKDYLFRLDFSKHRSFEFSKAVLFMAELVKDYIPEYNQLAILTQLTKNLRTVTRHDVAGAQSHLSRYQYRHKFQTREVDGMVQLEMPRDPWPKRFATDQEEEEHNFGENFDPDNYKNPFLTLPRGLKSAASVASAPVTFSSDDISSPPSFRASISSGSHRYTASEDIDCTAAGDLLVPIDTRFGPAFNDALLKHHMRCFEHAQSHLPADAVLFVGNLPSGYTDLQLVQAVTETFRSASRNPFFVSVSRTYTRHDVKPHALVQFYTACSADEAFEGSHGKATIAGRKLRVEFSHAKRSLVLLRQDGCFPAWHEIDAVLGHFGDHKKEDRRFGVHVTFTCYGSYLRAKEALQGKCVRGMLAW